MAEQQKKQSDGGLWKKSNEYGEYYWGKVTINGQDKTFRAYPNTYKQEGDKTPDFRIVLFEDNQAGGTTNQTKSNSAPARTTAKPQSRPGPTTRPAPSAQAQADDVPF